MSPKDAYLPRPGAKKRPEPEAPADTTRRKPKPWSPWRKPSLKPIGPAK